MKRFGIPSLIGLAVAAAGVIAPIAWDWWTGRAEIELQHLVTTSLVQRVEGLEQLEIRYGSRSIPSVTQMDFAVANTGNQPIREEDLVEPPTLHFPEQTQLLDAIPRTARPANLKVNVSVDTVARSISVTFPLLNPGDRARFSVLLAQTPGDYTTSARIVGVRQVNLVDKTPDREDQRPTVPWTVWLAGGFSLLCLIFLASGFFTWGGYEALSKLLEGNALALPKQEETAKHIEDFIRQTYGNIRSDTDIEPVIDFLGPLPDDEPLTDDQYEQLQVELWTVLTRTRPMGLATVFIFILFATGTTYVIWSLL